MFLALDALSFYSSLSFDALLSLRRAPLVAILFVTSDYLISLFSFFIDMLILAGLVWNDRISLLSTRLPDIGVSLP